MPDIRIALPYLMAAVTALAVTGARGQQDLDAGKTGPQLFSQDCAACHRSPRGLAKTSGSSLVSFLRQHYTSSSASANVVAAYLQGAGPGPADRPKDRPERQKDAKQGQPPHAQPQPQQAQPAVPAPDRTWIVRPSEPIPSAVQPEAQPAPAALPPAAKKRERHARPSDPAANTQGPANGQSRRKARHPGQAEPAPPPAPEGPAYPPAAEGPAYPPVPNLAPATTEANPPLAATGATEASPPPAAPGATEVASPTRATPAQPSFVEPLP